MDMELTPANIVPWQYFFGNNHESYMFREVQHHKLSLAFEGDDINLLTCQVANNQQKHVTHNTYEKWGPRGSNNMMSKISNEMIILQDEDDIDAYHHNFYQIHALT
ncbi:hypothetical protein ACJX0J_016290, partial [Zea mays]